MTCPCFLASTHQFQQNFATLPYSDDQLTHWLCFSYHRLRLILGICRSIYIIWLLHIHLFQGGCGCVCRGSGDRWGIRGERGSRVTIVCLDLLGRILDMTSKLEAGKKASCLVPKVLTVVLLIPAIAVILPSGYTGLGQQNWHEKACANFTDQSVLTSIKKFLCHFKFYACNFLHSLLKWNCTLMKECKCVEKLREVRHWQVFSFFLRNIAGLQCRPWWSDVTNIFIH